MLPVRHHDDIGSPNGGKILRRIERETVFRGQKPGFSAQIVT
jgi:hypothetical protein